MKIHCFSIMIPEYIDVHLFSFSVLCLLCFSNPYNFLPPPPPHTPCTSQGMRKRSKHRQHNETQRNLENQIQTNRDNLTRIHSFSIMIPKTLSLHFVFCFFRVRFSNPLFAVRVHVFSVFSQSQQLSTTCVFQGGADHVTVPRRR